MTDKCVFCLEDADTVHHIIPKSVRKVIGWNGKQAEKYYLKRKVPMCRKCHNILNMLIEPIIFILKCFRPQPEIPVELAHLVDDSIEKLMKKQNP